MANKQGCVPTLNNFFVFNSTYMEREGEEESKILFYYPEEANLDQKIRTIGLCEALIKFTETFSKNKLCESFHTQKARQLFLQPEPQFWIVMTLGVPFTERTKDGQTIVEYSSDEIQDHVYLAVLKRTYRLFKLFMGTFVSILMKNNDNKDALKQKLDHFFRRYLYTLKPHQADILDVFQGIQFLPLDKNAFLKVQCFINHLEAQFSQISHTVFLYNDQLVWSGLAQEDMQILYYYLKSRLIPASMESELQGDIHMGLSTSGSSHYGRFVTGSSDASVISHVPKIFIYKDGEPVEYHLFVYRSLSSTVCCLIKASVNISEDYARRLDNFMGPQLTNLVSEICEQYGKIASGTMAESQFKYLYFNHMNLAQKSTVHSDYKRSIIVTPEIMKILIDVNKDLFSLGETSEVIIKTMTDCWVVGKLSDQREFYLVLQNKNANLLEINDEVKKVCSTYFHNIFFLE